MKKLNRYLNLGTLVIASFLTSACGQQVTGHYSKSGATVSAGTATSSTATLLQGEWINCTTGILTTYSFTGNGYWLEVDTYDSSDCTDGSPSLGTPEEGTFQLSSGAAQGGYGQTITFVPFYANSNSDGASQSGTYAFLGSNLIISKNGAPSINFLPQAPDTTSSSN